MTKRENLIQFLLDKRVLVCAGLMFSMSMTTGFVSSRHVTIAVDGNAVELSTPYRSEKNILSQAGISLQPNDEVVYNVNDDGSIALEVKRAVPITVNYQGTKEELLTCKDNVGEVLNELGYIGKGYKVNYKMEDAITSNMIIEVEPVKVEPQKVINTAHGAIEYRECMTMEATAYLPNDGNGDCITATGVRATRGIAAVDPDYIPLGSKLYIPGYGFAVAADTGGAIEGDRIDLCMEGYNEAMDFGRRDVQVYLISK